MKYTIIVFMIFFQILYSNSIKEIGYGKTQEQAKENATQNLSKIIKVDIKTEEKMVVVKDEVTYSNKTELESELIIFGIKYSEINKEDDGSYSCFAYLDSEGISKHLNETKKLESKILEKLQNVFGNKSLKIQKKELENITKEVIDFEKAYYTGIFLDKTNTKLKLKEIKVLLNGKEKTIKVTRNNIESLKSYLGEIMVGTKLSIELNGEEAKLNGYLDEYRFYLEELNRGKIKFVDRERSNKLLTIIPSRKDKKYKFYYDILDLKDGKKIYSLKSENEYVDLESGFIEDLMDKTEILNKKIGEILNEK